MRVVLSAGIAEVATRPDSKGKVFIPELHGLRGLALALVVAFHLFGQGRVSGGVDVFLFISAFLLTGSLLRSGDKGETSFLSKRYARTFSRLVPPALAALGAVAVGVMVFLPKSHWYGAFREVVASALYLENIELINSSLAYGAAGPDASALQHFWSLSLQGQFFVLWPIAVLLCYLLARLLNRKFGLRQVTGRRVVLGFTLVASAASFLWAIYLVRVDQQVAYFSSYTRFWQLGLGALVALVLTRVRVPSQLRNIISWLGVGIVMFSGFFIDGLNKYPGPWALVPLTGVVLVLVGSGSTSKYSVGTVLNKKPIKFTADISYGLYLWHWPILVFYLNYRGWASVGWKGALGILAVSVVIAAVSKRVFDVVIPRIQNKGRWKTLGVIGLATAVLVSSVGYGAYVLNRNQQEMLDQLAGGSPDHPGALVLANPSYEYDTSQPAIPAAEVAYEDRAEIYSWGCVQHHSKDPQYSDVLICEDPIADGDESLRVVLTGGSHAAQWYPALREVATTENWELIVVEKNGCRLRAITEDDNPEDSCVGWNQKAPSVIIDLEPDVVMTVGSRTVPKSTEEYVDPLQVETWNQFADEGIQVVVVRDNPRFTFSVPDCLLENPDNINLCGKPRDAAFPEQNPILTHPGIPDSLVVLDLTDSICGPEFCDPVVGNVTVYRDTDHFTNTFARTLAPVLHTEMLLGLGL